MPEHAFTGLDLATLQRLLLRVPVPLFIKDNAGRCIYVNQAFETAYGVTLAELQADRGELGGLGAQLQGIFTADDAVFATGQRTVDEAMYWSAEHDEIRLGHTVKTPLYTTDGRAQFVMGVTLDITNHRDIEEALRSSDQRFRDLVDFTDGIVWEADADTFNNTFVSKSAERVLGYPVDDWLLPNFWINHVAPEDQEGALGYSSACVSRQEDHEFEYRFRTADGRLVWIHDKTRIVLEDGKPRWLRGLMIDITERKRVEQLMLDNRTALAESEQRYRVLLESLPDAVFLHRHGKLIYVNQAAVEMADGGSVDNMLGKSLLAFVHPSSHAHLRARIERARVLVAPSTLDEDRFVRLDGTQLDVEVIDIPVRYGGDRSTQSVVRDITARKQAQEQLHISHQSLKAISQGVVITDPSQRILSVNDAFTAITGYPSHEVLGRTLDILRGHNSALNAVEDMRLNMERGSDYYGDILHYRKDGVAFWNELTISPVRDAQGLVTHFIGVIRDSTQRRQNEEEIRRLAFYDPLTELPNRRLLMERLTLAMATTARTRQHAAVLFLDLDHFKQLNDTMGHDVGDMLLKQVGVRLKSCVREGDCVARLGGDEFVLLLERLSPVESEAAAQAEQIAHKILDLLRRPFMLVSHIHNSTPSVGIVLFVKDTETIDDLLKKADIAMYQAKAAGRNTARFYEPAMQAAAEAHTRMERDLRMALVHNELVLHYQVKVETSTDGRARVTGAEALVRWNHPVRGMVPPGEFIPLAEETGLIQPLGQWVLETACRQLVAWAANPATAHWTLSVNVSAAQISKPDFVTTVLGTLQKSGARPQLLELEITESMLMNDIEEVISKMDAIRSHGVRLALDDFGTGFSSLSYLKRLPLNQLKIDKSFVRDLLTDPNDAVIARTIVALGHSLGLKVVAEGVESEGQHAFLASIGCDAYQGYYFGRPMAIGRLADTLCTAALSAK